MLTFCIMRHILRSAALKSEKPELQFRTSGQILRRTEPQCERRNPKYKRRNFKGERRNVKCKHGKKCCIVTTKCCVAGTKTAVLIASNGARNEKTRDFGMFSAWVLFGTTRSAAGATRRIKSITTGTILSSKVGMPLPHGVLCNATFRCALKTAFVISVEHLSILYNERFLSMLFRSKWGDLYVNRISTKQYILMVHRVTSYPEWRVL